ncbi:MAG: mitochondrial fission ELM1 family protein, partial [Proteobacteria bacterium]|nr:mitochondrial fission ELM1 family protein [Pseudomonadota bacterium]
MDTDDPPAAGPAIWLLIDDRAGNRSQCLGVAEALGLSFEVRDLEYTAAGALPHGFLGASFFGLSAKSRAELAPPWPDLVIAAGRRTAPVARRIKRLNGGATYLVQIMDPGSTGVGEFDLIAAPRHDTITERPNVMRITGAPHRITPARLAAAAAEWRGRFADLPRPWIALIVGGSTRRRTFTDAMARDLGRAASAMAADAGGALLVTTSRRTGAAAQALL